MKKKLLFSFLVIIFTSAVVTRFYSIGKEKETKKSTSHEYKKIECREQWDILRCVCVSVMFNV